MDVAPGTCNIVFPGTSHVQLHDLVDTWMNPLLSALIADGTVLFLDFKTIKHGRGVDANDNPRDERSLEDINDCLEEHLIHQGVPTKLRLLLPAKEPASEALNFEELTTRDATIDGGHEVRLLQNKRSPSNAADTAACANNALNTTGTRSITIDVHFGG